MGRKRKSGEGTVRLRKDGRWEGRIVIGYEDVYKRQAENLGGYPQGYLEIGTGLGLLEQVTEQQGAAPLTRGDMAILVCNSLGLGATAQARLLYQGQGSIRIVTSEGKVIYIDPYAGTGYDLPADLILVTHDDPDHNKVAKVALRSEDCRICLLYTSRCV